MMIITLVFAKINTAYKKAVNYLIRYISVYTETVIFNLENIIEPKKTITQIARGSNV